MVISRKVFALIVLAFLSGADPAQAQQDVPMPREVRVLVQKGLAFLGFDPGPADGVFGRRTRAAIRDWQKAQGRTATGRLTPTELRALKMAGAEAERKARRAGKRRPDEAFGLCPECSKSNVVGDVLNEIRRSGLHNYIAERPNADETGVWLEARVKAWGRAVRIRPRRSAGGIPCPKVASESSVRVSGTGLNWTTRYAACQSYCPRCIHTYSTVFRIDRINGVQVVQGDFHGTIDSFGAYSDIRISLRKDGAVTTRIHTTDSRYWELRGEPAIGAPRRESALDFSVFGSNHQARAYMIAKALVHLFVLNSADRR